MGEYGEIYVGRTVNRQKLFMALERYMCKVYEKRAEIESQKNVLRQKKADEEARRNAVSYEEYCRLTGIDIKKSPLEVLSKKLERESKRDKDGGRK